MLIDNARDTAAPQRMLTVSEVAYLLHVHPNTIRSWSDKGLLTTYRLGHRHDRRFSLEDIDGFLKTSRS